MLLILLLTRARLRRRGLVQDSWTSNCKHSKRKLTKTSSYMIWMDQWLTAEWPNFCALVLCDIYFGFEHFFRTNSQNSLTLLKSLTSLALRKPCMPLNAKCTTNFSKPMAPPGGPQTFPSWGRSFSPRPSSER